ncbi:hypothetical protein ACEZCY_09890 [Streptacidiphilus sp. N1-12]|uniref:DUF11 domain-containing protein n=2 Tax=Streptacidiphilus alkalitolerans TaxID=3342712 RepID=A0ABV6WBZ4_9ACTN
MAGSFEFSYETPQISEETDHVTWEWTATNTGAATVTQVTLTSSLSPYALQFTKSSGDGDSTITGSTVKTRFATVAPGVTLRGTLEADLPADLDGPVQISGRVTWKDAAQAETVPTAT